MMMTHKRQRSTTIRNVFMLFVILLALISNQAVYGTPRCKYNEFITEDIFGNKSCVSCPICRIGFGLTPQCGSTINYGEYFRCEPCQAGSTYSTTEDISSCRPCGICTDHMSQISKCTPTNNSKCGKNCDRGFYYSDETFDCQECSWCCQGSQSSPIKGCQVHGVPFYKQCSANDALFCKPKCSNKQFVYVDKSLKKSCIDCPKCPVGQGLSPSCSSVITRKDEPKCTSCIPGMTFSDVKDSSYCKKCSKCEVGKKIERLCNTTHDTLCGDCKHGFYKDTDTKGTIKCRECSFCCGDSLDVQVSECVLQGLPADQQCAYTDRAVTKCQPNSKKSKLSMIIMASVFPSCFVVIVIILSVACWCFWKSRKTYKSVQTEDGSECSRENVSVSDFTIGKENPSLKGTGQIDFPKSGVKVLCDNPHDSKKILDVAYVQAFYNSEQCFPKKRSQEVFLSPIFKLHPEDLELKDPVKLQLFHSAHVDGEELKNWSMTVLKSNSYDENPSEWTNLGHRKNIDVDKGWVEISDSGFGRYIVIGNPGGDGKLSKKRMCCAVFGEAEPRVNAPYHIRLYLIDDCEPSYQKLLRDEANQGYKQMASLRNLRPDVHSKSSISIHVEISSEGWTSTCNPQKMNSKAWLDSYDRIPKFEATFVHEEKFNKDFKCIFKLKQNDEPVAEIPVMNFFEQDCPAGMQVDASCGSSYVNYGCAEATFTAAQPTDVNEVNIEQDFVTGQKFCPEMTGGKPAETELNLSDSLMKGKLNGTVQKDGASLIV